MRTAFVVFFTPLGACYYSTMRPVRHHRFLSATAGLAEQWRVMDAVAAQTVEGSVAWRRVAREMKTSPEALRSDWIAAGGSGSPLLPSVEPWQYENNDIVGLVDGETVRLTPRFGGDHALSHSLVFTADGAFELGAPSDEQIKAWGRPSAESSSTTTGLTLGLAATAPLALAALGVVAGVLTHHLQIEIFVI